MKKQYIIFFVVSIGLLLLFVIGFFSLKKQIEQISLQVGKSIPEVSVDSRIEGFVESKISQVENDIHALRMYVYKQAGDEATQQRETAYRSGYDDFSIKCKNIDNIRAEDLFKKPYYKNLSETISKTIVSIPPTETGSTFNTTTTLSFPWSPSMSNVLGVCEDSGDVYVIGAFQPEMLNIFYIVGEFNPEKNTFNAVATKDVFFFLKEVEKDGDVLNFLPDTDVCPGEGDFFVRCGDSPDPSSKPYHEVAKPGFQYNFTTKKFTILDPKIINK